MGLKLSIRFEWRRRGESGGVVVSRPEVENGRQVFRPRKNEWVDRCLKDLPSTTPLTRDHKYSCLASFSSRRKWHRPHKPRRFKNSNWETKDRLGLNLLHSPSEPLVDFIFVHGLSGGSRRTWSETNSTTHYWPQEWISKDPAFKNVRVQSFGYKSELAKDEDNYLNTHHFGESLLSEIKTSPTLGHAVTPIVLVGHSTGGLVIKKAYMLAREDASYGTLAKRFHTIYFLATPHRGFNYSTKLLEDIFYIAYRYCPYMSDLKRTSSNMHSINDEFAKYTPDIDLWSFYETQKLKVSIFKKVIVDPDSATLGCLGEKRVPMNADHHSICKFKTPGDSDYVILRNALAHSTYRLKLKSQQAPTEQPAERRQKDKSKDVEGELG